MMPVSRKNVRFSGLFWSALLLAAFPTLARVKVAKLAEKLLYGDVATRNEAVRKFNKLPPDAQERLVPDFMVALSDEDPQVRKIASRILKAMGVKSEGQIPDAKMERPTASTHPATEDKWAEEKKMRGTVDDKWSDLTKMRTEGSGPSTQLAGPSPRRLGDGNYADLKRQIDLEKKGQVTLDASQLRSDSKPVVSPLSAVLETLKDPDSWVRAQGARRLAMIHPAPVEAIPALIKMLGDKETESRRAAVAALGSFGHLAKEAILPLNSALSDPDPDVRTLAADALKQIQQPQ